MWIYLFASIALLFNAISAQSQIITTIACNGTEGFGGDGGPAKDASIKLSISVVADNFGNIFFTDTGNRRIRKILPSGIITTVAGGDSGGCALDCDDCPALTSLLNSPNSIALDKSGILYIADTYNHRVRKLKSNGNIVTVAGICGQSGYNGDNINATQAILNQPHGIAFDTNDNLFIADSYNFRIRKVESSSGLITTIAGTGTFDFSGDGGPAINATFSFPFSVAVDKNGNVYISDFSSVRVRKISFVHGKISTVAGTGYPGYGGDGGLSTLSTLNQNRGVFVDDDNNLYIADTYNNRIRRVSAIDGKITTVVGNGTYCFGGDGGLATNACLAGPYGGFVRSDGTIFILDSFNYRIRAVTNNTLLYTTTGPSTTTTTTTTTTAATTSVDVSASAITKPILSLGVFGAFAAFLVTILVA